MVMTVTESDDLVAASNNVTHTVLDPETGLRMKELELGEPALSWPLGLPSPLSLF